MVTCFVSACSFPSVLAFRLLDINTTNNLRSFLSWLPSDSKMNIQAGYSRIVENRGKFNSKALCKLVSGYCNHSVLSLSEFYALTKRIIILLYILRICRAVFSIVIEKNAYYWKISLF
jgi:hypothetical protein